MNPESKNHEYFMKRCLELAHEAEKNLEVPIGAVIVHDGKIISESSNKREKNHDATGHAEILAIHDACQKLQSWRLSACDLYVTLEPCLMCAGALVQARIRNVYFGAYDPKGGALGSLYKIHEDTRLNHRFPAVGGVLGDECGSLLSTFFKKKRAKS
uniref:tRNA-specific adenosine deaminase n=1 Tax=uncultured bacterium Ak20-3 TaxID=798570 RepID=D9MX62_9BACT|nr:hypothetical protein AKSOIL_0331 [uncultured bacterium Ak20-3]